MDEERDLLTVVEVAHELGLTVRAVQDRLLHGHMRGSKVTAKLWLVPRAEVERARAAGRLKPGPKPKGIRLVPAEGASKIYRI